jgi:Phage tail sheath C-terminal domain
MALTSPGVQVTVNDESFYTPAEAGTTPLVIVATAQDKSNASGTGIAKGTLAANIGKVYRVSSQRELVEFYGTPVFKKTVSGSPRHGDEQNEYGLQAAYSFLGISNTAYIARADINLNDLNGTETVPGSEASDGQWWLDTQSTKWGIFEWDATPADLGGQKFVAKTPIVLSASDSDKIDSGAPVSSVGKVGDYAVVAETDVIRYYYKGKDYTQAATSAAWHLVGTPGWRGTSPAITATIAGYTRPDAYKFTINNVSVSIGSGQSASAVASSINGYNIQGVRAGVINNRVAFFVVDHTNEGDSTNNDVSITFAQSLDGDQPTIASIFGFAAGVYYAPELSISAHTSVPQWKLTSQSPKPSGSVWVKATEPNQGSRWRIKRWNNTSKAWVESTAPLYADGHNSVYGLDKVAGGQNIVKDSLYVQYNYTEDSGYDNTPQTASFKIFVRRATGSVSIVSGQVTDSTPGTSGSKSFTVRESILGSKLLGTVIGDAAPTPVTVTFTWTAGDGVANLNAIAEAVNSSDLTNIEATISNNRLILTHKLGGEFRLLDTNSVLANIGFVGYDITQNEGTINLYDAPQGESYDFIASGWLPLAGSATGYVADMDPPLNAPLDGQYWYSNSLSEVDIMVHDGDTWVGYQNEFPDSDPNGPLIGATKPQFQSDGTALSAGDLWIDTSDLENYPTIYRWNVDTAKWTAIDTSDHTSEDGIVFADARWTTGPGGGAESASPADLSDLRLSDFVDPDAPDPELYPKGILLWNTRRSGFNVKVYRNNYINVDDDNPRQGGESMIDYFPSRWVTKSGSAFGRKAQRLVVVEALKAVIATNQEIREDEVRSFNLIACPGYPEVLQNMVDLNNDRGGTAFVVGDSPLRLQSDTTSLTSWGSNTAGATDNGDEGLVTYDAYSAVFYPSGLTNDNTGNTVVVPASHMMLKTIALSDQVSYPWFAPAGLRRGAITNATSVGYIDKTTGEFKSVSLTEGQRDALYGVKINPLTFFNGVGLVNYGQRTRSSGSSALDRINVARLVVFLRSQLNKLAKPYVFEPNDKITRDEIKQAIESLLLELVGLRAIYDYAVVCDETNNTPARIDRNELYVDIAIEPVKAIEFIYIPLRLKNTGEIQGARAS